MTAEFKKASNLIYSPSHQMLNFAFFQEGKKVVIKLTFIAHPLPKPDQVVWYHEDYNNLSKIEEFELRSGQSTNHSQFEAFVNYHGDREVIAELWVNNPNKDLLEGSYYLEVSNEHGGPVRFDFSFT